MSLGGRLNDRLLISFLPACRPHKLKHFFRFGVRTSCSLIFGMLPQHFLVRMASPYSKTIPSW